MMTTVSRGASAWTPAIDHLQLSPKKALRAELLKKRFADTILKAKQKRLFDPINLRQDKARIEDQIRAAKVASSFKAQEQLRRLRREREREREREAARIALLKMEREREREAARIALQNLEKTVDIEDNIKVLKELEIILFKARQGDRFGGNNIMERIGLFLKNDYMDYEDEEEADGLFLQDWEEGQICN